MVVGRPPGRKDGDGDDESSFSTPAVKMNEEIYLRERDLSQWESVYLTDARNSAYLPIRLQD